MLAPHRRLTAWGIVAGAELDALETADRGRVVTRRAPSIATRALRALAHRAVAAALRAHR